MNKGNAILTPDAKELDALSELHKALGDYTRIRILWLLMKREWCVSELAGEMKMTESAQSPTGRFAEYEADVIWPIPSFSFPLPVH